VVDQFHKMEETELMKEKRGNLMKELRALAESTNVEAELQDVDLFKLLTVFEKILKREPFLKKFLNVPKRRRTNPFIR